MTIYDRIRELSQGLSETCVKIRRDFHRYPETGWLEMRTSAKISEVLHGLGYEVYTGREVCEEEARMGVPSQETLMEHAREVREQGTPPSFLTTDMEQGFTGVVGVLRCGEGPVAALRFDIDALGLVENPSDGHRPSREGFASVNQGMMHACGHDGHAAIGLGVAHVLMEIRSQLHGTVKLLFQPGEEGARGARAMVARGWLDDVDFFVGTHIAPDDGPDDGDLTPGTYGSLATTKYDVYFHGKAAHAGGFPEKGCNALAAAACAVMNLLAIPRHSEGISRINVGALNAGTGRNVIPNEAKLELEVRGETTEINRFMDERAVAVCRSAANMYGCACDLVRMGAADSQHSDQEFIDRISAMVSENLPDLRLSSCVNAQNWGSEDISLMMNRVQERGGQAVYMRSMTFMESPQHTVNFDFDEQVLPKGVETFAAIVYDLLR